MSVRKCLQPRSILIHFETSFFFEEPQSKIRRLAEDNQFLCPSAEGPLGEARSVRRLLGGGGHELTAKTRSILSIYLYIDNRLYADNRRNSILTE